MPASSTLQLSDEETAAIVGHIVGFFSQEVAAGRMGLELMPLQAGIGSIANAVLRGLIGSPFRDMAMYSEVLQESAIALLDSGQLRFASASSLTLSSPVHAHFPRRFQAKPSSRWQP